MEKVLVYIKHHLKPLWWIIESTNDRMFKLLFASALERSFEKGLEKAEADTFSVRRLETQDIPSLAAFLDAIDCQQFEYFNPHGFGLRSLYKHHRKAAFLMMAVFDEEHLVGYFFLRFFFTKRCFVGRIVDPRYQKRGIGAIMNRVMYHTAWGMGFRCLATISRNNAAITQAHAKNPNMVVRKELQNNYLLVEFLRIPDASEESI